MCITRLIPWLDSSTYSKREPLEVIGTGFFYRSDALSRPTKNVKALTDRNSDLNQEKSPTALSLILFWSISWLLGHEDVTLFTPVSSASILKLHHCDKTIFLCIKQHAVVSQWVVFNVTDAVALNISFLRSSMLCQTWSYWSTFMTIHRPTGWARCSLFSLSAKWWVIQLYLPSSQTLPGLAMIALYYYY